VENQVAPKYPVRVSAFLIMWAAVAASCFTIAHTFPSWVRFASGLTLFSFVGLIAAVFAVTAVLKLFSHWLLMRRGRPAVEVPMVGRLYNLLAALVVIMVVGYSFGKLGTFAAIYGAFGGMLLGWSLQAPVSGFAAWVLVSLKRPFRPGDRVQFPNLGLTGDVVGTGAMYTTLNQVGGSIGSEEAVGRHILVPNAMLFSQVVINYTVLQESAYMLDEVVVRITYDSNWEEAEKILITAAKEATKDIIEATGVRPYVRSDMYDYGVFLRLRYQTAVKDRVRIVYEITKRIFTEFQRSAVVDWAIPFVYSYKAALERREEEPSRGRPGVPVRQLDVRSIRTQPGKTMDPDDVEEVAQSIARHGLLQPIVVTWSAEEGQYDIVAGQLRFEACRRLGWKTVPVLVQSEAVEPVPSFDRPGRAAEPERPAPP
jgi:small-conductance mechanosensitive channel